MKLSGSDIIVECLLEQGADTIFGYPGGAVLNIYDSLYKYSDKIRHVITCHEQGACHAADVFILFFATFFRVFRNLPPFNSSGIRYPRNKS
mgnify:CR=1 FL=1